MGTLEISTLLVCEPLFPLAGAPGSCPVQDTFHPQSVWGADRQETAHPWTAPRQGRQSVHVLERS